MKKLLIALFLVGMSAYSQDTNIYTNVQSTSPQEYKFLTAGLKDYVEKGTDMKAGYKIQFLESLKSKDETIKVNVGLFFLEDKNELKGISIVLANSKGNKYLAIPINNIDLMHQYEAALSQLNETETTYIAFALSKYLPIFTDMAYRLKNTKN